MRTEATDSSLPYRLFIAEKGAKCSIPWFDVTVFRFTVEFWHRQTSLGHTPRPVTQPHLGLFETRPWNLTVNSTVLSLLGRSPTDLMSNARWPYVHMNLFKWIYRQFHRILHQRLPRAPTQFLIFFRVFIYLFMYF